MLVNEAFLADRADEGPFCIVCPLVPRDMGLVSSRVRAVGAMKFLLWLLLSATARVLSVPVVITAGGTTVLRPGEERHRHGRRHFCRISLCALGDLDGEQVALHRLVLGQYFGGGAAHRLDICGNEALRGDIH